MLFVVDVGNTNIVLGIYEKGELTCSWRMPTTEGRTSDETGIMITSFFARHHFKKEELEGVVISSVVPNIIYPFVNGIRRYFAIEPMIVDADMKTGIRLPMENPKELGADRIVNMAAAYEIYGGPVMVIDYGTATTFDVVDKKGNFVTGLIAPGIQICADALYQKAAKLAKVEIKKPDSIVVHNTTGSLQAGIVLGKVGETVYFIERLKKECGMMDMKIVATGGLAQVIDSENEIFDVLDNDLTLKGLKILYEKNKTCRRMILQEREECFMVGKKA